MSEASIILDGVTIEFPLYHGGSRSLKKSLVWRGTGGAMARDAGDRVVVKALNDVTLSLNYGDRVGLVGPNGAGKTTLLRTLAGVYEPTYGSVAINGHISPMFDAGFGLDLDATGYENIILLGLYLGMTHAEARHRIPEVAAFSELGPFLEMPVRAYSSGMVMRLAFSVLTSGTPEILLMDEWVMAGDAHFFERARRRIADFVESSSILVLATHNHHLMRQICNKAVYMRGGRLIIASSIDEVLASYENDIADAA